MKLCKNERLKKGGTDCVKCNGERDLTTHGMKYNLTVEDNGSIGGQGACGDSHIWRCVNCMGFGFLRTECYCDENGGFACNCSETCYTCDGTGRIS